MANGNYEIGFWATLSGLIGVLIGPPLALLKVSSVSKKDLEKNNADRDKGRKDCQSALHEALETIRTTQNRQTAWIMAIANKVEVNKEDVREL